jgi:hypothetical protein
VVQSEVVSSLEKGSWMEPESSEPGRKPGKRVALTADQCVVSR